ncbi:MAG TPA: thiolase family protein [Acidimicrobiales bacterium]|nr:thiolase family protein [Acidimicrobiales bacterium]
MSDVTITGAGMIRFGKFPEKTLGELTAGAVQAALDDAGITADAVDAVFFANSVAGIVTGQESIRGQTALRRLGLLGRPVFNVENACASGSSGLYLGRMGVAAGRWGTVLVVGAEKMAHPDRTVTYRALEAASDLSDRDGDSDYSGSIFMEIYAEQVKEKMKANGATQEDLAWIAVKNRQHAAWNPLAQYQSTVTLDEVLGSGEVAWPLTRFMCSPIGDGAAAVVLSGEAAASHSSRSSRSSGTSGSGPGSGRRAVRYLGSGFSSGDPVGDGRQHLPAVRRAAALAFEEAGVGPEDVSLAEVHDAAAPAEMDSYEGLGLCPPGDGIRLVRDRATALGGPIPVNTSGGLVGRGHPVGATGVAQLVELVQQLRGEAGRRQVDGATIGVAQNAGGDVGSVGAASAVHVLGAPAGG